jgi:hypothetical protein
MKKLLFCTLFLGSFQQWGFAQTGNKADSSYLVTLNQQIDSYVVSRNLKGLDSLYAGDFVFSHGSGKVEGKSGWLKTVERANYPLRQHDSVKVELHEVIAIVKGKMAIQKTNKDKTDKYHLRYIRIYALRNGRWLLISHNTTHEWHEH